MCHTATVAESEFRNKQPILDALTAQLNEFQLDQARVLEIASGTGQHVAHFAAALPDLSFQPTELEADELRRCASLSKWNMGGLHVWVQIVK